MINKQQYEAQLQHIFRLLLENKTQEEMAHELNISPRTVARYFSRIDQRYGQIQRQKTNNTIFLEAQLFKHRMLTLYKGLENIVLSEDKSIPGGDRAKCAEVAANIAIDVLKMESEGIRVVKNLVANDIKGKNILDKLNNNDRRSHHHHQSKENDEYEDDNDRKFC